MAAGSTTVRAWSPPGPRGPGAGGSEVSGADPIGFAPRPFDRLSALGRRDRLDARCVRCGHRQRLDPTVLLARHGDLDMAALRARLLCIACGGRHPELLRSWTAPQD